MAPARAPIASQPLLRDAAFIDGAWVHGSRTLDVTNPADGSVIGQVPLMGANEARLAVDAAHRAQGPWAGLSGKARSDILRRWAELMLDQREALARLMTAEQGKPLPEAAGEVAYAASFLEWFAEEARRVTGALLTPHATDRRLLVRKSPVGVVAAVTPWNFPLAMITRKAGPALAAGCTFVVKPSELTPLSALALARLGEEAGLPPGVFNVIMGDAPAIGDVLTGDKRVRKFTFTGSTAVGKELAARCAATVKRVSLELGGNAPFIVFDDADIDAAIEGAVASKFRNAGQTCVCANRILVQSGVHDEFAARLAGRVRAFRVGPGLAGPTDQGPLIDARALAKAQVHVEDAVARGGRLLTGGTPLTDGALVRGHFFAPTVIADVPADALLCREETFGPVAGIVRFETEEEAIRLANDTDAGLAAYVYTRDLDRSWRVPEALDYGMVGLNTGLISTEVAPFGGVKESGLGREGSSFGMDDYLDIKLTCVGLGA
ncbi:NAD-dependent succinate-semialdehyde dehydrogenase [Novosphingobium piscinae]|uniref:NAD-dependent succinate-semialdehyde dehydrogenase n=1 Tax=Novosphingobium piscinae TaxID=1507448 RepID=A0A7X1KPF6_9SPHN|nr:NAD-dependent succinate-semialdehyde dehydrogenase [Novosphingobium piscinae]